MIKNLLFDLGGVIMDIKRDNCVASFKRLGMRNPELMLDEYTQKGPFLGIEDGSYTPEQFRSEIRKHIADPANVTDDDIDDAFSDFLIGIPVKRLRQLESLRKSYRIYLLSNTNPIMWHGRIDQCFRADGHDIGYYFDGIVTSFEARSVKPARRIFDYAVAKLAIKPEETLFLDDSQRNLDAAASLGFATALVAPGMEFIDFIPQSVQA